MWLFNKKNKKKDTGCGSGKCIKTNSVCVTMTVCVCTWESEYCEKGSALNLEGMRRKKKKNPHSFSWCVQSCYAVLTLMTSSCYCSCWGSKPGPALLSQRSRHKYSTQPLKCILNELFHYTHPSLFHNANHGTRPFHETGVRLSRYQGRAFFYIIFIYFMRVSVWVYGNANSIVESHILRCCYQRRCHVSLILIPGITSVIAICRPWVLLSVVLIDPDTGAVSWGGWWYFEMPL